MPATSDTASRSLLVDPRSASGLVNGDLGAFRPLVRTLLTERHLIRSFVLLRSGDDRLEPVEALGYASDTVRELVAVSTRALAAGWPLASEVDAAAFLGRDPASLVASAEAGPRSVLLLGAPVDRVGLLIYAGAAEEGMPVEIDALTRDVLANGLTTQRELARLARTHGFLGAVLRDVSAGVIAIDTLGRVILMNAAAEKVLGLSESQALGADALRVFRTLVDGENLLIEGLSGNRPEIEVWVRTHLGGEIPVELRLTQVRARGGAVLGAVAMFHDLSELRTMQERMRHRDRLASIGQLAAGIAHEIGNPLTGIRGCAQILRDRLPADSDHQELLGVIQEEVDRLNRLAQQVRHYGRPGNPKMRKSSIGEGVARVLSVVAQDAEDAGISIRCNEEVSLPEIYHDTDQIQQVLHNLFKNAIDAMSETGGRMDIDVSKVSRTVFTGRPIGRRAGDRTERARSRAQKTYVHVRVSDTGPGISPQDAERIFNPFFTTKAGGLGLGLSISQTIVTEHGGTLAVRSEPGKGTTFLLDLPVDRRAQ